jgi:hypothetical protein
MNKKCPHCNLFKYSFEYYQDRSCKGGLSKNCRDCQSLIDSGIKPGSDAFEERVEQRRDAHLEAQREYGKVRHGFQDRVRHRLMEETDLLYVATQSAKGIVLGSLRRKGYTRKSKTCEILGCSYAEFKLHIEAQFADGMGWHNRSLWHIDHHIPLASAKNEEDVIRLTHHTNLKPMWSIDNIKKSDKIPKSAIDLGARLR